MNTKASQPYSHIVPKPGMHPFLNMIAHLTWSQEYKYISTSVRLLKALIPPLSDTLKPGTRTYLR